MMTFLTGPRERLSEEAPASALTNERASLALMLRAWSRDWGGLLALGLTAYVVLFVVWLFVRWPFGEHIVLIDNLAFLPMSLAAGALAWRAASRRTLDAWTRRAWLVVGIAFIAYWTGDVLWLYYENVRGSAPFPSWADAGYLAYYPLLLLGLLLFPTAPRGGGRVLKFWLDSMTVLLGAGMVIWYLVLRPIAQAEDGSALVTTLSLAYPVGDLVLLFGITNVVLRRPLAVSSRALAVLAFGVLLFVGADIAFGYMSIQEMYTTGDWPDGLWIGGQLLMLLAAQYQWWSARKVTAAQEPEDAPGLGFSLLPPAAVVMSFGLLLIVARGELEAPIGGLIIAAVGLTTVVLMRQLTSLFENTRLLLHATSLADDLSRSEARFRSLVQNASDVIVVVDASANILYESPAVERILGYTPQDRMGTNALATIHSDEASRVVEILSYVAQNAGEFRTLEFRVKHADGDWRWLEVTVSNLLNDPSVGGIVGNYRDVTERKVLEEQLAHQASHDALTDLANRALFRDRLQHALARGVRHGEPTSILFLDLDDFKTVNDSLGHSAGDEMLVAVAERLSGCLRKSDMAARFGGDEFAVRLEDTGRKEAEVTAKRILRTLAVPVDVQGRQLRAEASIGIVVAEGGRGTQEELLRNADVAMYAAKGGGKARYAVFGEDGRVRVGSGGEQTAAG
jgi:diguanylate cyclase (GGDEF)-like protein/PAS domain S-box-containing protein